MTGGDLTIVIAGTREDGPGGGEDPDPARVPPGNRTGSGLSSPARPRSPPGQRPHRLDHAGPPARSPDINRFEVRISAPGDGWLERLGWRRWIPSRPPLPRPSSRRAMPAQGPAHSPGSPTIAKRPDRSPAVSRAKLHCKGLAAGRVGELDAEQRPGTGPGAPQRDPGRPHRGSRARVCSASTTFAARVASFKDVTRHPQNDRTRCLGPIASRRHHDREPAARRFTLDRKHAAARGVLRSRVRQSAASRESSWTAGTPPVQAGPQGP